MRKVVLLLCILVLAQVAAFGVERFPPPDFSAGYKFPTSASPAPRADYLAYVDVGVLTAALGLAAYLVIRRRSRKGIVGLSIFSLAYFGFYRHGCVCSIGAIQNAAMALGDNRYALPATAGAFLLLPALFALFFGRVFCAGVCPLGAIQDVVLRRPVKVPRWLSEPLSLLPWIYLGAAVTFAATGTTFLICRYDPFVAFFRFGGSAGMLALGVGFLLLGIVVGRPYCRFLCPYGALLRLVSPLSKWRVRVSPSKCIECRLCEESCPFGEIRTPSPRESSSRRYEGKGRLVALLLALPVMLALGAWLGRLSAPALSTMDPQVRLAERVWREEHHEVKGTTKESEAFYKLGEANAVAYAEALDVRRRFSVAGPLLGGWIGLVIGLKLIGLSIRRRRTEYEADVAGCVGCGRCFQYCPVERARQGDPEALALLEEKG